MKRRRVVFVALVAHYMQDWKLPITAFALNTASQIPVKIIPKLPIRMYGMASELATYFQMRGGPGEIPPPEWLKPEWINDY